MHPHTHATDGDGESFREIERAEGTSSAFQTRRCARANRPTAPGVRYNGSLTLLFIEVIAMNLPQKPAFPDEVREVYEALRNEVTFLHGNWDAFQQLFGAPESVAALNETAPGAFVLIRYVFRHEFIMAVSRITDPKSTGSGKKVKENLTLKQLIDLVRQHSPDTAFLAELTAKEQVIDAHCKPIREHRNRSIGHLDLQTALKYHPDPLPDVNSEHITEALRLLADFMNEVLGHYTYAHHDFVPVITGPARNIVHGLKEFQRLRKLEYERQIAELRDER